MTVEMWKYYSRQLDVSTQVKLTFLYLFLVSVYISAVLPGRAEIWEMLTVVVLAVL